MSVRLGLLLGDPCGIGPEPDARRQADRTACRMALAQGAPPRSAG